LRISAAASTLPVACTSALNSLNICESISLLSPELTFLALERSISSLFVCADVIGADDDTDMASMIARAMLLGDVPAVVAASDSRD
jgi:hypothetical protein